MTGLDYLRIFRRRWRIIAATVAVALLAAWVTAPSAEEQERAEEAPEASSYQATHTLLVEREADELRPELLATLARSGAIPQRVADSLDEPLAAVVSANVQVTADERVGTLSVTATAQDPEQAVALADTFAQEIVGYAAERNEQRRVEQLERSREIAEQQRQRVADLGERIQALPSEDPQAQILTAEREAVLRALSLELQTIEQLAVEPNSRSGLSTVEPAVAVPVTGDRGFAFSPPESRTSRLTTAGIVGLVLGLGLALVRERLDTRLRTVEEAEEAFGLPVVSQVPRASRLPTRRHRQLDPIGDQTDPAVVEGYERLRLALSQMPRWSLTSRSPEILGAPGATDRTRHTRSSRGGDVRLVVVTSAGPGDGKTTTCAHLATSFARTGKTVITVDLDGHNPDLSRQLSNGTRSSDPLHDAPGWVLTDTGADRLVVVEPAQGESVPAQGESVPSDPADPVTVLKLVQRAADVVIVNTGPLLGSNEAMQVIDRADAVIVAARCGWTGADKARRTAVELSRLDAQVLGVAFLGASDGSGSILSRSRSHTSSQHAWTSRYSRGRLAPSSTQADIPDAAENGGKQTASSTIREAVASRTEREDPRFPTS